MWYDITIPKEFTVRADSVTYTTMSEGKQNSTGSASAACYYGLMGRLTKIEITCRPNIPYAHVVGFRAKEAKPKISKPKSAMPLDMFHEWIDLCKKNGLCSRIAYSFVGNNQNCLYINGNKQNKHRIYATLCIYRWAECNSPLPYTVLELLKINNRINFFQALHFAMGLYVNNINHSFCEVGCYGAWMGGGKTNTAYGKKYSLGAGTTVGHFFSRGEDKKCYALEVGLGATNAEIRTLMGKLIPPKCNPTIALSEVLDEKYTPLYALKHPTREEVAKASTDILLTPKKKESKVTA